MFFFLIINASAELYNGLVAYYPFNGNAIDESPNTNNGEVKGAILSKDRFGNNDSAYTFKKDGDYIKILDSSLLNITDQLTVCAWAKPFTDISQKGYARIVSREYSGAGNRQYNLTLGSKGLNARSAIDITTTPSSTAIQVIGENIVDNKWHYLVMTFDKNDSIKLYVDDLLAESIEVSASLVSRNSNVYIGDVAHQSGDMHFYGSIDEVRIYNRVLSESEIHQLYSLDNNCQSEYQGGYEAGKQFCINNPDDCGITVGLYTEEDMLNMVNKLLQWDVNKDKQLGLVETIKILRDTSGIIKSPQE